MRKYKEHQKQGKESNGKPVFTLGDPPDDIIEALNVADTDFFPNIRKLLTLRATSHIGSTKTERAASGRRQLKIPYRSTVSHNRKSDLIYCTYNEYQTSTYKTSLRCLLESVSEKCLKNLHFLKINCC